MSASPHRVVVLGGGFGGLYAVRALARAPVEILLVDQRNFHLFQPLLYQVATGMLSPGDIASPLRSILSRQRNATVFQAVAAGVDVNARELILEGGRVPYDTLIVAAGTASHYFGHEAWGADAPSMKTVEDALDVRRRIFSAFELAELDPIQGEAGGWLRFAVIGAGPTGVEMAGALAEVARGTLRHDFRRIDPSRAKIMLVEGSPRVLPGFAEALSRRAESRLRRMGVDVRTATRVIAIDGRRLTLRGAAGEETVLAGTILWAAGVRASPIAASLAESSGCPVDSMGRVKVEPDLTVPGHPEIFVIGDLANYQDPSGRAVPGMAPAAMQQGAYAARTIVARLKGRATRPFRYRNKGMLAVIGRNAAVADLGWARVSGFWAWAIWALVHISYLIEFDNKILVLTQWAWTYFTRKRSARLITGEGSLLKLVGQRAEGARQAEAALAPPAPRSPSGS